MAFRGKPDYSKFANTIGELEKRELCCLGFTLPSGISEVSIVHFTLRQVSTRELCVGMDINRHTGAVEIQSTCG